MVPIKYNVRNLVVRKSTTAAAAFGLALVVFEFAGALMLANGIERTLGRASSPDVVVVLRKGSDTEMTSTVEDKHVNLVLAQAAQIGASKKPVGVGEVLAVVLLDKVGVEGVSNVTVRGVTEDVLAFRPTAKIVEGRGANPGSDEVVIGKGIQGRFKGMMIGQSFELKKNRPMKVVGVFSDDGSAFESEVWADVHAVRQAFGRSGSVSSVRVHLDSPSKFDAFKVLVEGDRQMGLIAMREADYVEKQAQATGIMLKVLGGMVAFFFAVGAMIGATITMNAQVAGRSREIGTLRALDFSKGAILFSFLIESLVLSLSGGAIGAICAFAMKAVKITMLNMGTFTEIVFGFEPTPPIIVSAVMLSAFMGLLGGFLPAVRAARVSPVEAMRG
jgi:putative ABC transport system permease protein